MSKKTPEHRRASYDRMKQRMACDPEYAARKRDIDVRAREKYAQTKKQEAAPVQPHVHRTPGRIVSLCGWMGW